MCWRISLNITGHDLDKYFEKEEMNKRNENQAEISTSLKTINLDENRNSQIIVESLEEQKKSLSIKNSQSDKLESSSNSNNISRGTSKDGSTLLTLDDAITGSVHIQENEEVECKITKEKILEILTSNGEEFKIGAIDDNVGVILLDQILNITINVL